MTNSLAKTGFDWFSRGCLRFTPGRRDRSSIPASCYPNGGSLSCRTLCRFKRRFVIQSPFGRHVVGCRCRSQCSARRHCLAVRPWAGRCGYRSGGTRSSVMSPPPRSHSTTSKGVGAIRNSLIGSFKGTRSRRPGSKPDGRGTR